MLRFKILTILFALSYSANCKSPIITKDKQPKRIIRMCCAFGTHIKVFGLPFITLNKIVSPNNLGHHQYLNAKTENNGIVYTEYAGFIDIAHVRDQADWTAYLNNKISRLTKGESHKINLGKELGSKTLTITLPSDISKKDILNIAGNIAYDLSTWHEIASWYGATQAPILNEKFSSFSFEDNFSNALGVFLGKQAILSHHNYDVAMDSLILDYLNKAHAVKDNKSTEEAMLELASDYWNPQKSIPNKKLLIERNYNISKTILPIAFNIKTIQAIQFPEQTSNEIFFNDIYTLSFKTGYRFPLKKIFPNKTSRYIDTEDFSKIIDHIKKEALKIDQ